MDNNIIVITPSQLDELITNRLTELKEYISEEMRRLSVQTAVPEKQDEITDINGVMQLTKWSKPYIYTLASKKLIPHYKKGGRLYFKRSEIQEYLCSEKVSTVQDINRRATTYTAINKRK